MTKENTKEKLLNTARSFVEAHKVRIYDFSVQDETGITSEVFEPANPCQDSYSVAKLFTVTALGMLWDEKKLSFDEKITDLFRDELPGQYDRRWEKVTVDQVMRHCFGTGEGFLDIDVEDILTYGTSDFLKVVFTHPLAFEPGEHDQYSDAAYYLLSRVVSRVTGQKLDEFLLPRLFVPLEFQEIAWSRCPFGYPMGATGLYIRTRDMVKLGWMYLQQGRYNGRQIVSPEFVQLALHRGYELHPIDKAGVFGKGGMRGQMLFFSVGDSLAVAWHGFDDDGSQSLLHELTACLNPTV